MGQQVTPCRACGNLHPQQLLLCRQCWRAIGPDLRTEVTLAYREAIRRRRRGQTTRAALLAFPPYIEAATQARREAVRLVKQARRGAR